MRQRRPHPAAERTHRGQHESQQSPVWPGLTAIPHAAGAAGVTASPAGPHTGDDVAAHAGEVRVNVGGEPDRDDSGLPPVDIEIPDDARELDRDVQAYHRELRAQRRRMRIGRLHAPLTRDGLMLPLLAGFLAMVLISGVLLTVFTADQNGSPRSASSAPVTNASIGQAPATGRAPASQAPATSQPAGKPAPGSAARLPDATVIVDGQHVRLSSLTRAVLTLVPAGCRCSRALRRLRRQATAAQVTLYLVGTGSDLARVRRLATRNGRPAVQVANDPDAVLATAYRPHGLTAVLVRFDGSVGRVLRDLPPALRLTNQFRALALATP
jgi:hypothetical protein